jgi:hypothetical protein
MKLTKVGQVLELFHAESSQKCLGSCRTELKKVRFGLGRHKKGSTRVELNMVECQHYLHLELIS